VAGGRPLDGLMQNRLVPAAEALEIVLDGAAPHGEESLPLADAAYRVLARDLAAKRTQPPFPASAMDGYAVRSADIATVPAILRLMGQSVAGNAYDGVVKSGEAVRIFTGAPVPEGADAVVMQENSTPGDRTVTILKSEAPGRSIRAAGLDFREGDVLLNRSNLLEPLRLALAASMNHERVPVFARPRVALIATGDELVMPGGAVGTAQIIASNTFGIGAVARAAGGELIDLGIVADRREALDAALREALARGADLVVTTGGASVGDHDLVKPALLALGVALEFEKLALRPGKPMLFGRLGHKGRIVRFLGLAGNPVSSLVASYIFLRPLVNRLAGRPARFAEPVAAGLGGPVRANDERQDYLRAAIRRDADGTLVATPLETQDSSMLAALARAGALVVRAPHAPAAMAGEACEVILLNDIEDTDR